MNTNCEKCTVEVWNGQNSRSFCHAAIKSINFSQVISVAINYNEKKKKKYDFFFFTFRLIENWEPENDFSFPQISLLQSRKIR